MKYIFLILILMICSNQVVFATEFNASEEITSEEVLSGTEIIETSETSTEKSTTQDTFENTDRILEKLDDIQESIYDLPNQKYSVQFDDNDVDLDGDAAEEVDINIADVTTEEVTTEEATTEQTTTEEVAATLPVEVTTEEATTEDYSDVLLHTFISPDDDISDSKILRKIYNLLLLYFIFELIKFFYTDCRAWFNKVKYVRLFILMAVMNCFSSAFGGIMKGVV